MELKHNNNRNIKKTKTQEAIQNYMKFYVVKMHHKTNMKLLRESHQVQHKIKCSYLYSFWSCNVYGHVVQTITITYT